MTVNPVDSSCSQHLLVKLIQVLSPLTKEIVSISLFLKKCFSFPSEEIELPTLQGKQIVDLLTDFQAVRGKFNEWIEVRINSKDLKTDVKSNSKIFERRDQANVKNSDRHVVSTNKRGMLELQKNEQFGFIQVKIAEQKGSKSLKLSSLETQFKKLVKQVQQVICKLAASSYSSQIQEVFLKEILEKLKPQFTRMLSNDQKTIEKGRSPLLLISNRRGYLICQKLINNLISSCSDRLKESSGVRSTSRDSGVYQAQSQLENRNREVQKLEGTVLKSFVEQEQIIEFVVKKILTYQGFEGSQKLNLEKIDLPGAPYQGQARTSIHFRKKKKRKSFWSKKRKRESNS